MLCCFSFWPLYDKVYASTKQQATSSRVLNWASCRFHFWCSLLKMFFRQHQRTKNHRGRYWKPYYIASLIMKSITVKSFKLCSIILSKVESLESSTFQQDLTYRFYVSRWFLSFTLKKVSNLAVHTVRESKEWDEWRHRGHLSLLNEVIVWLTYLGISRLMHEWCIAMKRAY